jgi:1,4-dihydroxy-2-naphthoate polyprenyltransferase
MSVLRDLVRSSKPLDLLFTALTYVLGAGLSRYLGAHLMARVFWLGLIGVLLAQTSMGLLSELFRGTTVPSAEDASPVDRSALRNAALYVSIGALAAAGTIAFLLHRDGSLSWAAILCALLLLLLILAYGVPPARLLDRGLGELVLAIVIAYLVPALGFLLQARNYHILLNVSALPLVLLLLGSLVAMDFQTYAEDLKYERGTLLVRLGWEQGLRLHHVVLGAGYMLLGAALLFGFSWALVAPAFLTLPFAALQVYFLQSLALGAKPLWRLLNANAIAVFGLTAYFLTLSFWLR